VSRLAAVQSPPRSISKDLTLGLILIALIVSSIALLTAYYVFQKESFFDRNLIIPDTAVSLKGLRAVLSDMLEVLELKPFFRR
jgi:hypothetical protein